MSLQRPVDEDFVVNEEFFNTTLTNFLGKAKSFSEQEFKKMDIIIFILGC